MQAFVNAINAGDRDGFDALLTPDATMSDDGTDRDLTAWVDKEIFSADGRMDIESESADGLELVATFTNSTWGAMRTAWRFTVDDGRISRFDTGQA
ncbi:nuclear transport factor 2 family protein [Streptomyces sp. YGL11-2]|uniref:nuclear transport factor 2 family protein n=1 Tax=Streptomyces sp. YGL11-2 TaxID=3414028 RepID=UPI003CF71C21